MKRRRGLTVVETAGAIAWFTMDACWMLGAESLALVLVLPTVVLNLVVFRYAPRTWASALVTGAMVAWACMNVLWMVHDFGMIRWGLVAGKVFLALGALMVALALVIGRSEATHTLFTRFRRLRPRA
ncbi:MAG TPA: hypothetical protein VM925_12860 [Labilithrix sp.]|nr:hypothetical protein [Labilithrix sp.]